MISDRSSRSIIEDYKPYIDINGFVQPDSQTNGPQISQNGVRFTSEYVIALALERKLNEEKERLKKVFKSVEQKPGLLMRTPENSGGYQSIDDTIGAITVSYLLGTDYASNFLKYGREKFPTENDETDTNKERVKMGRTIFSILKSFGPVRWVYNNINPQKFHISSYLGRFPQLIAHAMFAAGEPVPIWRQIWWSGSIIYSAFSKSTDAKALAWQLVLVGRNKSILCDLVSCFWSYMLKKHYPNGIGGVLKKYWSRNHPSNYWLRFEYGEKAL